jgi:hypothetical protein
MQFEPRIVSIGVTGHRFLAEESRVVSGIDQALERIRDTYPGSRYHILSAIAEGADRIVAARAIDRLGAELVVVLPLPKETYREDFGTPDSSQQFDSLLKKAQTIVEMEGCDDRAECYERSGRYIVDRSDVMIAVWDGLPAQGTGGVGDIVAYTRSHQKPILIVAAGNRRPGTDEPTSLGERQGELRSERI